MLVTENATLNGKLYFHYKLHIVGTYFRCYTYFILTIYAIVFLVILH